MFLQFLYRAWPDLIDPESSSTKYQQNESLLTSKRNNLKLAFLNQTKEFQMKKTVLALFLVISSLNAFSYDTKTAKTVTASQLNIVDTAVAAGNFKTLAAALGAAGLVETLKGAGPFTVFAPTDAAFAKLPAGTLEKLLKPENKAQLIQILTYHVVGAAVLAKDVKAGDVKTVEGSNLVITTKNGVTLNGNAKVTATDIKASNGVIHVIDTVVLPAGLKL